MVAVRNERAPFYWGCTAEVGEKTRCCNKKAWRRARMAFGVFGDGVKL